MRLIDLRILTESREGEGFVLLIRAIKTIKVDT